VLLQLTAAWLILVMFHIDAWMRCCMVCLQLLPLRLVMQSALQLRRVCVVA
jgi:hypothetical protein